MKQDSYIFFHSNLMGMNLYKNGELIPKYIVFWSGYNSHNILIGKSKIKAVKR